MAQQAVDRGKSFARRVFSAPSRGHRLLPPLYCGSSMRTPAELIPIRSLSLQAFELTDRVAIVTGGNGGLGLAMAAGLARAGAAIAIAARDQAKSKAATKQLGTSKSPHRCYAFEA